MRDFDIRLLLRQIHLSKLFDDPDSKIVEELKIPAAQARIDLAVINGHLHGFEIKSAVDTLRRLPNQIQAYTKVFDYLSIITEGKYYQQIINSTPDWVGVYTCTSKKGIDKMKMVRPASINNSKEAFYIAKLLWRTELLDVLQENNIRFKTKDRNWLLAEALASNLSISELSRVVRARLKQRENWKVDL